MTPEEARAAARKANEVSDRIADGFLVRIAASPFSGVIVAFILIAAIAFGWWLRR